MKAGTQFCPLLDSENLKQGLAHNSLLKIFFFQIADSMDEQTADSRVAAKGPHTAAVT